MTYSAIYKMSSFHYLLLRIPSVTKCTKIPELFKCSEKSLETTCTTQRVKYFIFGRWLYYFRNRANKIKIRINQWSMSINKITNLGRTSTNWTENFLSILYLLPSQLTYTTVAEINDINDEHTNICTERSNTKQNTRCTFTLFSKHSYHDELYRVGSDCSNNQPELYH